MINKITYSYRVKNKIYTGDTGGVFKFVDFIVLPHIIFFPHMEEIIHIDPEIKALTILNSNKYIKEIDLNKFPSLEYIECSLFVNIINKHDKVRIIRNIT